MNNVTSENILFRRGSFPAGIFFSARCLRTVSGIMLSFLLSAITASCTLPAISPEKAADFKTTGFIDNHRFQIIISSKPDMAAKGLVAQRESALLKARNGVQQAAADALINHRLELYFLSKNVDPQVSREESKHARPFLQTKLFPYVIQGKVVEEYYEKDNTAIIVFRIEKENLKKEIETADISEVLKKDKPAKE
jgi:hypothetical protein